MNSGGGQPAWQDAASPPDPTYQPNEAFSRVLQAKQLLDQRTWGNRRDRPR